MAKRAYLMTLSGRVQGVGFRPYVLRLAKHYGIAGWVRNEGTKVRILAEGEENQLRCFQADLLRAPKPAAPFLECCDPHPCSDYIGFAVFSSAGAGEVGMVPKDAAPCPQCVKELFDVNDRRYRYPLIACAQCGPRYSALYRLPYDRRHSSMAPFPLCAHCAREYHDHLNRRFHAEMIACPHCGPKWWLDWQSNRYSGEKALLKAIALLNAGLVIAVKGVGGYHLLADAMAEKAVARVRTYKKRPQKPLAIMVKDRAMAEALAVWPEDDDDWKDEACPIVLLPKQAHAALAPNVAPGLDHIGLMLPPTPLLLLLAHDFARPLVATSANFSDAPIIYANTEMLQYVCDAVFDHERPIIHPLDDALVLWHDAGMLPIRLGRGLAPLLLPSRACFAKPWLALGGEDKVTLALGAKEQMIVSAHIGHLADADTWARFVQQLETFPRFFGVSPQQYIADAHPGYVSHQWLKATGMPAAFVFHHRAHAASAYFAAGFSEKALVFTWDGSGFGEDGTLWGGEAFVGFPGCWQRFASLLPFTLPGAEAAIKEPFRVAYALAKAADLTLDIAFPHEEALDLMWQKKINTPQTSAVGRLFDAIAVILGLGMKASFEAELALKLESLARKEENSRLKTAISVLSPGAGSSLPKEGLLLDWRPLLPFFADDSIAPGARAFAFHAMLADFILAVAKRARAVFDVEQVAFSGGVFQNTLLLRLACAKLRAAHFMVAMPKTIPVNDAGIAIGQLLEVLHGAN
jgi:hydrogenase maturation protein HypF